MNVSYKPKIMTGLNYPWLKGPRMDNLSGVEIHFYTSLSQSESPVNAIN